MNLLATASNKQRLKSYMQQQAGFYCVHASHWECFVAAGRCTVVDSTLLLARTSRVSIEQLKHQQRFAPQRCTRQQVSHTNKKRIGPSVKHNTSVAPSLVLQRFQHDDIPPPTWLNKKMCLLRQHWASKHSTSEPGSRAAIRSTVWSSLKSVMASYMVQPVNVCKMLRFFHLRRAPIDYKQQQPTLHIVDFGFKAKWHNAIRYILNGKSRWSSHGFVLTLSIVWNEYIKMYW